MNVESVNNENVRIDLKVSFPSALNDYADVKIDGKAKKRRITGTIVYINRPHRFFTVQAELPGGIRRECFKF